MKHQLCSECSMVLVYSHGTYQGEVSIVKPVFCPYCASPLDLTALEVPDKDPSGIIESLKKCIKELRNYSKARKGAVLALKEYEEGPKASTEGITEVDF